MLLSRRTRQTLHLRQFDQINQKDITGLSGHGPRRHQQFIDILTHHATPPTTQHPDNVSLVENVTSPRFLRVSN